MDKITAGIIDKLSIFDFFNVIISGGVLLFGISPILDHFAPGYFYEILELENDVEKGIAICLLSYIFGSILKGLQEVIFKGVKSGIVKSCLAGRIIVGTEAQEGGVVKNKYARKGIIVLADKLFEDKKLGKFDPDDKEMCQCFFDHCEQSNSVNGFGGKAGQLSEKAEFYEQLSIAFYIMAAVGILLSLFTKKQVWLYCLVYLVMGGIFNASAYNNHKKWAKKVLTTYEAVFDMEAAKEKDTKLIVVKDA